MILDNTNKQRIAWIDILKGIGIIFVVLGHVIHNDMIFNWIYSFHMPLFFFAGGYLYKKDTNIVQYIKHKFRSIMVPYFSFGLLVLLYWYFIERKFRDNSQTLGDAFLGLLSGEYQHLDFNVHLWFLPCFFLVVVTYNLLNCLFEGKWLMLVSVVMALIHSFVELPELIWGTEKVCQYIIFFTIGDWFAQSRIDYNKQNKILVLAAIVAFVLNIVFLTYGINKAILWYAVALLGIIPWIVLSIKLNQAMVLQYLGKISIVILCIHGPIYRVLIKVISLLLKTTTDAIRENLFMAFIIVIVTLIACKIACDIISPLFQCALGKRIGNNTRDDG